MTKLHFIVNRTLEGKVVYSEDYYYRCKILKQIGDKIYLILGLEQPIYGDQYIVEMVNGEPTLSCNIEIPTIEMGAEEDE